MVFLFKCSCYNITLHLVTSPTYYVLPRASPSSSSSTSPTPSSPEKNANTSVRPVKSKPMPKELEWMIQALHWEKYAFGDLSLAGIQIVSKLDLLRIFPIEIQITHSFLFFWVDSFILPSLGTKNTRKNSRDC